MKVHVNLFVQHRKKQQERCLYMFHKLLIISASSLALTFGGVFASGADSTQADTKQLAHKVLYTMDGDWGSLSEVETSNLLKKAFENLQGGLLKDIDFSQFAKAVEVEKEATEDKAEQPAQEVQEPKQETPAPVEKEEQVQNPQEPKQEEKAPVAKEEKPVAQPQPEKVEQPQAQEKPATPVTPEQPKTEEKPKQEQSQSSALSQFESQVVELTNQERAKNGLQPLQVDNELSAVAREKSRDMAVNGYFDHNSPTHGSPFDMMKSYGITYNTAGENIAQGQRTPQEVVNAWMNSSGHRANILNGNFTHIGVGFVEQGNHWTQQFIGK